MPFKRSIWMACFSSCDQDSPCGVFRTQPWSCRLEEVAETCFDGIVFDLGSSPSVR